jgi:Glu-tRNA(Gln) amidotransferase subunit E-like FAD-binding protein
VFAGVLLSQRWVALRRAGCAVDEIPTEWVAALLEAVGRRVVLEAAAPLLLEATVEEPGVSLEALVKTRRLEPVDEEVAKARAAARIEAAPKPETSDRGGRHRYYMGEVMQELRGRFPGAGLGVIVEGILEDLR